MAVNCERCGEAIKNQTFRFCVKCRRVVLRELQAVGYLQDTYVPPYFSEERGRKGMRSPQVLGGVPH
jgi:hypothetical protein